MLGSKSVMYIQKGFVGFIPQALPMAFPLSHVEE